jgi:hypothetical protein
MEGGLRAVQRGLQDQSAPAGEALQPGAPPSPIEHRVGQADDVEPLGGIEQHLDEVAFEEGLAACDVQLGEALPDRIVDQRAEPGRLRDRLRASGEDRAVTEAKTVGLMKFLIAGKRRLIGAHIAGHCAARCPWPPHPVLLMPSLAGWEPVAYPTR